MNLPLTTIDATRANDEPNDVKLSAPGLSEEQLAALQRLAAQRDKMDPERRAFIESIAEQNKIKLPPMTGFSDKGNPRREQMSDFGEAARVSALPMAGQLAGGLIGTAIAPGPGSIIGQSVGGVAGLMGNKLLGISNPDATDAAITGAVPAAGKVLTSTARRALPGVEAAEQQLGAEAFRSGASALPGSKAATTAAYDKLEALGSPSMPATNFQKTVNQLFDTEQTAKKYGGASPIIRRAVQEAGKTMEAQQGTMPFRDVEIMLKRYRQKTSDLEGKGGEVWGAYKDLRKALFDDMAAAEKAGHATKDNVTAMKEAIAASKMQIAKDEFAELVEKYGIKHVTVNGQTFEQIDATKVLNKLKDLDYAASAGPVQAAKIEKMLKDLAAIPKVDIATGTGVGTSGRAWAMAGAAAAGGALGQSFEAGLGGAAAAYGAIQLHDVVAGMAMSDKGRNFLVKIFKANHGRMSERTAQMLQFAATQFEDTAE